MSNVNAHTLARSSVNLSLVLQLMEFVIHIMLNKEIDFF